MSTSTLARIDEVARWRGDLPRVRLALEAEAAAIARPRIWPDTLGALASTGWRVLRAAAPDAPVALLTAAASAAGLPVAPPAASAGTLERAQRLVRAGGPTYVKLGQFIASARGLLPDAWVDAFGWCRDAAPPLAPGVVAEVVARELGDARGRLAWLDDEPLAAGSIGQAHRGRLDDGTDVVVKVRRPGLRRQVRSDVETLALAAAAAERLHPAAAAANLTGFVELFASLVLQELDLRLEALNLVESAAMFERRGLDHVRVPRPVEGLVTERLLVMDALPGVPYDRAAAEQGPVDGERLLGLAIQGVLQCTLLDGLFHGDLHAGNVLVAPDGDFSLVDFGICGRLDDRRRAALVRYLLGFAASDAAAQVAAMQQFGAVPADAHVGALARELQAELDRLDARADGAVTFDRLGDTLGRLLRVLAANGFTMPKELVLFFKNLLYLSAFAASVAPEADLFAEVTGVLGRIGEEHGDELSALLA
ncbi:AarF/ABC1/UbiB kinase family protein [Conexibacter sp. SYSU D00693]|uniref:ABC1 kinase family protein n=1 Tax=Conexibacter sp. SYSU D00693 TaxID=2812560 RepID=UPI001F11BBF5|nr:AarF/UbiB family protein [Conexibacter sp. SYSU D00693]